MDFDAFAVEWQAAWNSHDLDRILAHYSEDVTFRSAKAMRLVGHGELRGKAALRDYWARVLTAQPALSFVVVDVLHGYGMLVITYRNQHDVLAAETLRFGPDGLVVEASACHAPSREQGADLPPGEGLRFFGLVDIDGGTQEMTVRLMDRADTELYRVTLEPKGIHI